MKALLLSFLVSIHSALAYPSLAPTVRPAAQVHTKLLSAAATTQQNPTSQASGPQTWYVRADGAPPYSDQIASLSWRGLSVNRTCDGLHDAPWPAIGTLNALGAISDGQNQPCALSDYRWLYDNQGSYGQLRWIIAGGDTVILDNTKAWRVGIDSANGTNGSEPWCWGWNGGPYGCFNPPVPAGTAQHHTRILGRNWPSCSVGDQPDKTKMSQLFGGHGVSVVLNLDDTQYVDIQCLEITRHSQCVTHGDDPTLQGCSKALPLDDYDSNGMWTDAGSHDLLLQDIWDHGHTERGIIGPIGGLVTAIRLDISSNGMAGWDFDDGRSTPSTNAVLKMSYSTIEWSGCNQEYPAISQVPVIGCFGQSNAGYGDGLATPSGSGMDVYIDHSAFHHNTQDGLDLLHVDTGSHMLQVTNSASYANNGQQFKWGGSFSSVLFQNNVALGNCLRMSAPIIGVPLVYNTQLGDFCRAFDTIRFNQNQNATALVDANIIAGYSPTLIDVACTDDSCSASTLTFTNNIIRGYDNPATYSLGGRAGGPGVFYLASGLKLGAFSRQNNDYFGTRADANANQPSGLGLNETIAGDYSSDPQLTPSVFSSEAGMDAFLTTPSPTKSPTAPTVGPITSPVVPTTPTLLSIQVSPGFSFAFVGGGSQLVATPVWADGQQHDALTVWTSADPTVAAVSPSGLYTALKPGSTTMIATSGSVVSAPVTISVGSLPAATPTPAPVTTLPAKITIILPDGTTYSGTLARQE